MEVKVKKENTENGSLHVAGIGGYLWSGSRRGTDLSRLKYHEAHQVGRDMEPLSKGTAKFFLNGTYRHFTKRMEVLV